MATLPTPGADTGTWGDELNEFIRVSHLENGNVRVADGQRLYFGAALGASFHLEAGNNLHVQATNFSVDGFLGGVGVWGERANGTEIALAAYTSGESYERFVARANGRLDWGPGSAVPGDTSLYRAGAGALETAGAFGARGDIGGGANIYAWAAWGDAQPRIILHNNAVPKIMFGPGGSTPVDTSLYRSAANILKTDGDFQAAEIGAALGTVGETWIGPEGPAGQAGIVLGTAFDTNLYRSAANVLKTDDTFDAAAILIAGTAIGSIYQALSAKGAANGYASLDGSGAVPDAQIPAAVARDAEVTAAISTHSAAADPHTGYQKESEKGVASGYASLDSSGLVPAAQLPAASGTGVPAGSIVDYAGASAPSGWLLCDGSSVSRATYPLLFAAIGITYGALDGSSFSVPDFRGRMAVGKGTNADVNALALDDGTAVGSRRPKHKHTVNDPGHAHTQGWNDTSGASATGVANTDSLAQRTSTIGSNTTGVTVGPQTNVPADGPAYLVVNKIIKT